MGKWRFAADPPGPPPATVSSVGHAKMAQNPVLSRLALSLSKGLVPAALASAALALLPWQLISEAQEQE